MNVTNTENLSGTAIAKEVLLDYDVDPQPGIDNARTLELRSEDIERYLPRPTTQAPWFGYETSGEIYQDAVVDNDDVETVKHNHYRGGCTPDFDIHIGDTYQSQGGQTNTTTTDNDTVDTKNPTVNIGNDYNGSDHAGHRGEGRGERGGSGDGGERSGANGGGRAGSEK